MNFVMSDEEILRSFNTAAHPSKQVAILADLNATDVQTMCAKLKGLGVDYKKLPRQKKDKPETPIEKKVCSETYFCTGVDDDLQRPGQKADRRLCPRGRDRRAAGRPAGRTPQTDGQNLRHWHRPGRADAGVW